MSESDGDFSDELLELAGASEKKRKKSNSRPHTKRRKADVPKSDSEEEYESEEDNENPYPLEGKYIDEADREHLLSLPEIERENVLAQRQDEIQRFQDKRNLDQMLREQRGEADSVSKAAKRPHQARGATKEKTRRLDELKAKRKAKSEKKRKVSSPKRERSSSPVDMEMSSEDEEDGQISKQQQEEEREARLLNKATPEDDNITIFDLDRCRLTRDNLKQYAYMPWFEEFVKGSWVRYMIGTGDDKKPVYRICEIVGKGVAPPCTKPYKIDSEFLDINLELRYGTAVKAFTIDRVSNGHFLEMEFNRLKLVYEAEKCKLPTKRAVEKKAQQYPEYVAHQLTEAEVNAIIARKAQLDRNNPHSRTSISKAALERVELVRRRNLAQMRRDFIESAQLDAQIAELDSVMGAFGTEEKEDVLGKVNERNRIANREAVRRAEAAEADRKRKAWKAHAAASSRPGTPGVKADTPGVSPGGTPKLASSLGLPDTPGQHRPVSPLPGAKGLLGKRTFESIVANSVDIDLGDF